MPTRIIIPTAVNTLNALMEELVRLRRAGEPLSAVLPPFRQRAWMIVNETGVLPVSVTSTKDG
jgi:hypothetical protein